MIGLKFLCLFGVILALASGAPSGDKDDVWVLLVAGSNGYYNYRHQADVCHAYQIMISKGVPAERIIVMMYDDVANDPSNPTKGSLINKPGGPDVYKGVKIDYKEKDVTVKNFVNVLSGNKDAMNGIGTGRVIESTSTSHVFVNFVDHGGAGVLCFPNEDLYADVLEKALRSLAQEKKFGKLLMYIEACEAGSVFDNILEENLNIMVSTASARDESSWGWYCDDGNCLGDLYSITWMEHMDAVPQGVFETLFHQYMVVRTAVEKSHVNLYGDYHLGYDVIKSGHPSTHKSFLNSFNRTAKGVDSRDIPIHVTQMKAENAPDHETKKHFENKLANMHKGRKLADDIVSEIMAVASNGDAKLQEELETTRHPLNKEMFTCYREIISKFKEECFNTNQNTYFLQHLYKFANLCMTQYIDVEHVLGNMGRICNERNYDFGEEFIL